MIIKSNSFDENISVVDVVVFMIFATGISQTLGVWWNIVGTDLDEYFEYSIVSEKDGIKLYLTSECLREGTEISSPGESLTEINKFFDWLKSHPENYWGVQLILDDHVDDPYI